ncbi:hypothetical protein ACGFT2_24065 [Streptomyces sp. NPDC048514]|uniref:hypothetical protein n=1 Tax=Streptomyces sp. NPDC048514 TaxID=3365564 RepID=UPI003724899A
MHEAEPTPSRTVARRPDASGRSTNPRYVDVLLWGLALLDLSLAAVAFVWPGQWFHLVHGAPYVDPQGLMPRTGASWAMFAVLEAAAAVNWKRRPAWLAAIAAVRASDVATDWTYLACSDHVSPAGTLMLAAASPANCLLALLLWRAWRCRQHAP